MDKNLSFLGIIKKAGALTVGFDACMDIVSKKKIKCVFICDDVSIKTQKEIAFKTKDSGIKTVKLPCSMDDIYTILKKRVGVMVITDRAMEEAFFGKLSKEEVNGN